MSSSPSLTATDSEAPTSSSTPLSSSLSSSWSRPSASQPDDASPSASPGHEAVATASPSAADLRGRAVAAHPEADAPMCRLCWSPGDSPELGELISPCACAGSVRFIHVQCLRSWQEVLRSQSRHARAARCELCHQPYHLPERYREPPGPTALQRTAGALGRSARYVVQGGPIAHPPGVFLERLLSAYAAVYGLRLAAIGALAGLKRGYAWGYLHGRGGDAHLIYDVLRPLDGCPLPALHLLRVLAGAVYITPPLTGAVLGGVYGFGLGYGMAMVRFLLLTYRVGAHVGGRLHRGSAQVAGVGVVAALVARHTPLPRLLGRLGRWVRNGGPWGGRARRRAG